MNAKQAAGYRAAEWVKDGMKVGLGTGSTAYYAIEKIGQMVAEGLRIRAIATSNASEELAVNIIFRCFRPAKSIVWTSPSTGQTRLTRGSR
ncbi:hypothetical protein HMSSN036_35350 [Paenibacillus macerans]|nr:hypothetical protein HMSSN036_35350 [Paenibacillus macerans]